MLETLPIKAVARELLRQPSAVRWPYDVSKSIKQAEAVTIRHGSVGRILGQMEREGWLNSRVESRQEARARGGGPRRRYYSITDVGMVELSNLIDDHSGRPVAI